MAIAASRSVSLTRQLYTFRIVSRARAAPQSHSAAQRRAAQCSAAVQSCSTALAMRCHRSSRRLAKPASTAPLSASAPTEVRVRACVRARVCVPCARD